MAGAILLLRARTALHAGAGTAIGPVDLPIQREMHTKWPMIQGSGIKGVMRDVARRSVNSADPVSADNDPDINAVFGPAVGGDGGFAGALAVTDAQILAFPVRSLKGVYALLTCDSAIRRFADNCALAGVATPWFDGNAGIPGCECPDALFFDHEERQVAVLEDMTVELDGNPGQALAAELNKLLSPVGVQLPTHLLIVRDEVFNFAVQYRTQVVTRNRLDPTTKTVASGALFSVEALPPETIMYSALLADQPFSTRSEIGDAGSVMSKAAEWAHRRLMQFGGDATTGKGLCSSYMLGGGTQQ
jgi:CRISPR-associated protein Cmr4